MDSIYIIDAVNYLFRSYYGIGPMTNKNGISTSALYGFIRSVNKIKKEFSPKYIIAVFDGPKNTESRKALYSEYKMNRKKAPDDLYPQFELAYNYCRMAGISALCIEGVEADDTMASIATLFKDEKKVFLCTSDKDLMQLVDDNTFVLNAHRENQIFDSKKVEEKFGVKPKQLLDYLSIVGDASDNIPGVMGFGPKTTTTLLKEFSTLDNIYENLEKIPSKKKEILLQEKQNAYLSKQLATLNLEVEIPKENDFYELKQENEKELITFYKEMNFFTLLKDFEVEKIFDEEVETKYTCVNSDQDLENLFKELKKQKEIAVDTETSSLSPLLACLVGVGFSYNKAEAYYVPLNGNIEKEKVLSKLKDLLEDENISFFGHNIKYDAHIFLNYGINIKNISFDTLLASYILNPEKRRHNLDALVLERFGKTKIPTKDLIGTGKKQITMMEVPIEKVSEYCSEDVDYTFRLKSLLEKEIKEKKLDPVLLGMELPLLPVLVKMERDGIFVEKEKLFSMSKELTHDLEFLKGEIYSEAGKEFNINSPKQLAEILFVDLALHSPKKKFSTAADVLLKLKGKSPIIDHVIKYRELQKLLSTYVDALPKQINPNTNRVHSTFSQSTTATGRLSSHDPNLQNIPIRKKEGKKIREGFKPQKEGWSYLSADYSQIELRLLAHFSEDPKLLDAFKSDEDIHTYTASLVYGVPIEDVTKAMRSSAKAVNFGILYGQSAYGLSEQINVPIKEAKAFITTYFERYKGVSTYLEKCVEYVKKNKKATTLTGRERPIPEIDNKNPFIRAAAERLAINTPLQGTAADLIKIAMIEINAEIMKKNLKGFLILQIHDELIFEIPDMEIDDFKKIVKDKMENVFKLKVPLTVEIEIGKNLSEC